MSWAEGDKKRQKKLDRQWRLIRLAACLFRLLPHRWALKLGAGLGWCYWAVSKKRVDNAEVRCCAVLCLGPTEGRRVVRESLKNTGRALAEMLRLDHIARFRNRYLQVHGIENLEAALAEGRGVLLLMAHIDNWEMVNVAMAGRYPLHAIAAPQRDPRVTEMITELRAKIGAIAVNKGNSLKAALQCLDRGEVLAVLLDQDAKDAGLKVPFLGVEASTPPALIKLAMKRGVPVIPAFPFRRGKSAEHDLYLLPPLDLGDDLTQAVSRCNDIISDAIVRCPEGWLLWTYPRWGRPEPEAWNNDLVH